MAIGFDVGTYNLVCAKRNAEDKIDCVKEVNAFIQVSLENDFSYNMLNRAKVKLIKRDKHAYAVGENAVNIAHSFGNMELRRPMSAGCVNPHEKEGYNILATMVHGMIGEVKKNGEALCYSVPANAINQETDADYHKEILQQVFSKYSMNGKKVQAFPINEALAIIYAELQHKFLTGVAISCGAGMTNVCFAHLSMPVVQFSLVNSGDWIDRQAAKAAAVSATVINKAKTKVDLLAAPQNEMERAIQTQYRILIRNTVKGIKEGLEKVGNKAPDNQAIDVVIAGGASSPNGFDILFREAVEDIGLPLDIGEIKRAPDHLYTVAKGCLEAAEAAEE